MRLLLVDDDAGQIHIFNKLLPEQAPGVRVLSAANLNQARHLIENEQFDVAVVDLRIPPSDGGEEADAHGIALVEKIRTEFPGTPVMILTGYGSMDLVQRTYKRYMSEGVPFGGKTFKLFEVVTKENLRDCFKTISEFADDWRGLDEIELEFGARVPALRDEEKRVLKAAACSFESVRAEIRILAGGMSGARTFRFVASDANGRIRTIAVAKIGDADSIRRERQAYERYVAGILRAGSFATFLSEVHPAGTRMSGLFYRLAEAGSDGQTESLFDVLPRLAPDSVGNLIVSLARVCTPWTDNSPRERAVIGDIRRQLISDETLGNLHVELQDATKEIERRAITVSTCAQHRDLHGENVLVQADSALMLIDFGHVGVAPTGLDAVILELSLVTHARGRALCGGWPTVAQGECWCDLERYLGQGTPEVVQRLVRACRDWSERVAGGYNAVVACAYSYAVRQLRFTDVDQAIVHAIIRSCTEHLRNC